MKTKRNKNLKFQNQVCDRDLEKSNYLVLQSESQPIKCPDNIFKPITILVHLLQKFVKTRGRIYPTESAPTKTQAGKIESSVVF